MQKSFILLLIVFFIPGIIKPENNSSGKADSLKEVKLNEIVISANKTSTSFNEVASSVSIMTAEEIESKNKTSVADLLRSVEGVNVLQSGGPGQLTSVYLRGGKPHHTLILVDGIEMNDPSSLTNSFDWASLQTGDIDRIEILRGPQSTLYGSDALAGVISIFTKKGVGKPKFFFNGEGGTFNTYRGSTGISGAYSVFDYSLFLSHYTTDGISAASSVYGNTEKDYFRDNSLISRLGVQLNKEMRLDLFYNYTRAKTALDQNEKFGDDPNFFSNKDDATFRVLGSVSLFDKLWDQNIGITYLKHIGHITDGVDNIRPTTSSDQYFNGSRIKFDWQHNLNLTGFYTAIIGLETQQEKAYSNYISESIFGPYNSFFPIKKANTSGVYFQNQLKLFDNLFSSLGIRYDKHDKFGDAITYRIAPAYYFSLTDTKLRATYGTAFKSPSVFYLYDPNYGNPDLKPEKSAGWDAGVDQYIWNQRIIMGVTYFQNNFKDMLGVGSDFKTINIDRAELKGIEVFIRSIPVYNINFTANYTYTNSKDKGTGTDDSGKEIIRIPKNKIGVNLNYNDGIFDSNLELINVGERFDKDFSAFPVTRVVLRSYTLLNASVSYRLNKMLRTFGQINNILDQKYEEVLYYGTEGINISLGIGISF